MLALRLPVAMLAAALLVGPAAASPKEDIARAHMRGDFATSSRLQKLYDDRDSVAGQIALGQFYEKGMGVEADPEEAARWYRKAAERGDGHAQFLLGALIADSLGRIGGDDEALVWLILAVDRLPQGDERSAAYRLRQSVSTRLARPDLLEVQKRAREWKPKTGG